MVEKKMDTHRIVTTDRQCSNCSDFDSNWPYIIKMETLLADICICSRIGNIEEIIKLVEEQQYVYSSFNKF